MKILITVTALFCTPVVQALTFNIPKGSNMVGKVQTVTALQGDSLYSIGRDYDIGLLEMQEANPKIKHNASLAEGTNVLIPSEFILPPGERKGIVINLAELRIYYFAPDGETVSTYPIGIGRQGWRTPVGETTIVDKRQHPTWTPTTSIRSAAENSGIDLPDVIPAGPNNPLGDYAMNLGWKNYLIHGTNAPSSVGLRASHGCMRMYPEDIQSLFNSAEVGTKVSVIYVPFKVGIKHEKLFLEAHQLFTDHYYAQYYEDEDQLLKQTVYAINYSYASQINWDEAKELISDAYGYPVNITSTVHEKLEQNL